MKLMLPSFAAAALLLGACQSPPASAPRLTPTAIPAINAASVRLPETIRTYTLGAYVDADDTTVRHAAHEIHRIEQPARWQLGSPPESHGPMSAPTPLPAPPPAVAVLPGPSPIITPPPFVSSPPPEVALPPSVPAAPAAPAPATPPPELVPALAPNADGLVDLTAPEAGGKPDDINPFAVRATATAAPREIKLVVSGLVGGPTPGAVVNSVPLKVGEPIESLVLERVEADAVLLRSGERRVRLPVSTAPYRLRLAP